MKMVDFIRDGDTVKIASMNRLSRDTRDLCNLVPEITQRGATVPFVNENITVDKNDTSLLDSLILGILASFAEFERRRIRERYAEGIAIAKAKANTFSSQNSLQKKLNKTRM